jgi:O-antigen/teichoic acid export membrane protein
LSVESVKVSIVASFVSRFLGALVGIIAVPMYIEILGIESYGIIGFFITLQALVTLFDFGIGPTIIKEFSSSENKSAYQKLSDLAKACEWVYICVAFLIFLTLSFVIPWLVENWIKIDELNKSDVTDALLIGALALSIQWPVTLYSSGLIGLHKQLQLAILSVVLLVARIVSVLLVISFISPTIKYFFIVNLLYSCLQFGLFRWLMWQRLPKPNNWSSCKKRLFELRGFIGVMSGIALCSVLLTQLDKIILSNLLSLKDFGVYSLVGVLAGGLYLVIAPIFSVIYPKFSSIISSGKQKDVLAFYHKSAQLLSLILIPTMVVVGFFSEEIMYVWTGDSFISSNARWPLIFLVVGNALNGMMNVPYALQLAYGKPKLALINNLAAIAFLIPSIYYLATTYGILGGAFAWLILNLLYVLVSQYITHRYLITTDLLHWYWVDIGLPLLVCILNVSFFYFAMPEYLNRFELLFYLAMVFIESLIIVLLLLPEMRKIALINLRFNRLGK